MRRSIFALAVFLCTLPAFSADRQIINTGSYPGDGTGDSARTAFQKVNANDLELFSRTAALGTNGLPTTPQSVTNWLAALYLDHTINVKALPYNATGDGETDDTEAILAAIAAVPDAGGTVFFPAGTYVISQPISIESNCELNLIGISTVNSMQPLSGSILQLASGANCDMLVKAGTARVNVKGLVFDGNKANQTSTNLHGLWLQGVVDANRRCTIEDVIVWEVSGTGILNDNRESHFTKVHIGYSEGDGLVNTAASDVDFWNVLSGFNRGNGIAFIGVPGTGAGGASVWFGNFYRNGLNGLWLTNSANNSFFHCMIDANNQNGILGEGPSWRNRFISCVPHVNNYHNNPDQQPTAVPSGTYSNVKVAGDYTYDWEFIGCTFFQYESTELATYGVTVKYQVEDARPAFATNKYARLSFTACNFANGFCTEAPYEWPDMVNNASGEWKIDGLVTYPRNRTYGILISDKIRAQDQMEAAVGVLMNGYYADGWMYRSNGPAFYLSGRYDDPLLRIQYAPTGTSNAPLTWVNGLTMNSTNGFVGIGTGAVAAKKPLEVNGSVKADDAELSAALTFNAYYSSGWKRRADGQAYMIQPDVVETGGTNISFYIAASDVADSAITWVSYMAANVGGNVTAANDLAAGSLTISGETITRWPTSTRGQVAGQGSFSITADSTWHEVTFGSTNIISTALAAGTYLVSVAFDLSQTGSVGCKTKLRTSGGTDGIERTHGIDTGYWINWTELITVTEGETISIWGYASGGTHSLSGNGGSMTWVKMQ